jgi:hypothetical protein
LKVIAENTSNFAGGSTLAVRYADILYAKGADNRTAQEIADDVTKRAGLEVIKK